MIPIFLFANKATYDCSFTIVIFYALTKPNSYGEDVMLFLFLTVLYKNSQSLERNDDNQPRSVKQSDAFFFTAYPRFNVCF